MKRLILTAMILWTTTTNATTTNNDDKLCTAIALIAYDTMIQRQNGVRLNKILTTLDKMTNRTNAAIGRDIAITAYGRTRWSADERRTNSAVDFETEYHVECLKQFEQH